MPQWNFAVIRSEKEIENINKKAHSHLIWVYLLHGNYNESVHYTWNIELRSLASSIIVPPGPSHLYVLHEELVPSFKSPFIKFLCGKQNRAIHCRVCRNILYVWHWLVVLHHEVVQEIACVNHWANILQFWFSENPTKNSPNAFQHPKWPFNHHPGWRMFVVQEVMLVIKATSKGNHQPTVQQISSIG